MGITMKTWMKSKWIRTCGQCDGEGGGWSMGGNSDYPVVDGWNCERCNGQGVVGIKVNAMYKIKRRIRKRREF